MRFLTSVLVLALAASFRLIAAQNTTTPVPLACGACILNNIKAIPDCANVVVNPATNATDPSKYSDAEKKCFCVLANDPWWANKCNGADLCGAELITYMINNMGSLKAQYCPAGGGGGGGGANAKGNANALTGSHSKTAMAALAIGAVLAAF